MKAAGIAAGLAVAGVVLAGCGSTTTSGTKTSTSSAPAQGKVTSSASPSAKGIAHSEDVKITACKTGALGGPSATLVVTNHSSKASNYIIEIAFESADGKTQLGTGAAAVNSLQPGQSSAPQTADALTTTPAAPGFTCSLAQLTRYAA